ncbi:hypothetical protein LTS17_003550 [Exophiala oligosperma]
MALSHTTMQHVNPCNPLAAVSDLPRHVSSAAASAETRRSPVVMASFVMLVVIFAVVFSLAFLHVTIIPLYRHTRSRRFSFEGDGEDDAERALERARVDAFFKFNGLEYRGYGTIQQTCDSKCEPEPQPGSGPDHSGV